jgi:hypothetical protein
VRKISTALFAACSLITLSCQKEAPVSGAPTSSTAGAASSAPPGSVQHAAAGAKPGSHEDWCGEHEVPESLCTRCNPALVAAFKATGDWCPEHGLPESQCRICNPNLKIERPPQAAQQ